ncbi:MAG: DEAD/DEAH box helicase family protein, partial [Patescibacteria group bacterium]
IWDDSQNYPPRQIQGFYSKDSLQYLVHQRNAKVPLDTLSPRSEIVDRLYQLEAIKRVCERFGNGYRKALLVQATGTGKTRVAIALVDLLIRAGWVKRVLFLCDRKELRKQAKNVFNDFINEPLTIVRAGTAKDRTKRIYLSTYPAMMRIFETFDVGFFDLIIADESHRSIYNRYRDLFVYFDCLQLGLTATPVDFIARNTYRLFDCEDKHPSAYYPLERAVEEEYLVPYEVYTHTTNFLRSGIKYLQLTDEQRQQLEEDGEDPEAFDYEATDVDRQIFNRDTNRAILRNLMENGLREATGQHPGKTIIFARNHKHAILISELFDEMYPQYGGSFCQVIDNYDPRAEQLIDDFKGEGSNKNLT